MAPVCWARRLSLSCLCVWLPALFLNCYSLLTYDRQALLDIRNSVAKSLTNQNTSELDCFFNYAYESIKPPLPECFCRWPLNITRRKRRRKRGNCGGYIVKLKAHLRVNFLVDPSYEPMYGVYALRHPLDMSHAV
ncbi:uncharacterized protein LOC109099391 [Tachysurus ichikawai]